MHRVITATTLAVSLLAIPVAASAEARIEIILVGDVAPAGRRAPADAGDVTTTANPLRAFAARFERADLVVANLEGLLTREPPPAYAHSRLDIGARPLWAPMFAAAHVDVVSTANNHTADGGADALLESRAHVAGAGVAVIGSGATREEAEAPYLLERPSGCVAILPATTKSNRGGVTGAHFAWYPERRYPELLATVRELAARCLVVVYIHWGNEGGLRPIASVEALAHDLVDAGAGAVVGHHAHVLHGVEVYRGVPIAYSLGNFVFTNRTPEKRLTGALALTIALDADRPRVRGLEILPAVISIAAGFTPLPATARQRAEVRDRLTRASASWGTRFEDDGERLAVPLP